MEVCSKNNQNAFKLGGVIYPNKWRHIGEFVLLIICEFNIELNYRSSDGDLSKNNLQIFCMMQNNRMEWK